MLAPLCSPPLCSPPLCSPPLHCLLRLRPSPVRYIGFGFEQLLCLSLSSRKFRCFLEILGTWRTPYRRLTLDTKPKSVTTQLHISIPSIHNDRSLTRTRFGI